MMEMDCDNGHFPVSSADRHKHDSNYNGDRRENDAKRDLELGKEITLDSSHCTSSRLEGKTRIVRASDVLLSLAGRSASESQEPSPAVENFQEALRLFPPFRDDDAAALGVLEVKCPDCDAVFSSSNELKQHHLTRFCPGTAVAVYVMTRDRLITKGYRMEKRLIPLDSRPLRFYCVSCERKFCVGEEGETVERQRDPACFVFCTYCGSKCNISYEPILNDPRDDTSYRDIHREIASATHSRSPSLLQRSAMASKFSVVESSGEPSLAKKARKLRDSFSFRKLSQSDEDEMLAISFAGLYDLERVHAPSGVYQQVPANTGMGLSDMSSCSSGHRDPSVIEPNRATRVLCEDESRHRESNLAGSESGLLEGSGNIEQTPVPPSKRQSFLQRIFGRKVPKGVSRTQSTSNRGKKLMKRANTVRFSFVPKYTRSESRATARDSQGSSEEALAQGADDGRHDGSMTAQDAEYIALLRGSQNVFVHMQYLSGGAIVHDASGRQRILQVDEVAKLFLQLRDELSAATIWSQVLAVRMRGEAFLKQGNSRAAVMEFHDAIRFLEDTPVLDLDKQARAAILHSLGEAYRDLDMPAESEACYLEALGLYKRTLGRDHPRNFAVLHDLGSLCERDGYATEAAALYERSFAGRLKTLGQNAPETLSSMQDLASLKVLLGDLESALLLLEKAVPALDTVFGIQNATTLNAMSKLSLLYQKLGLDKESRTICGRTIPHCRTVFGLNSPVTRDAVVRYIQSSDNFDFPPDIQDILDHYRRSRDPDCLRVVHRLGRSYMDAGLNRDAADLFEALVEDFLAVKGPEAPETFDALSALCVSREHLDSIDKAILAYMQLVHMANRTPEDHHSRKRITYADKRIAELNRRREILASERKEWELDDPKRCENCGTLTTVLCSTCKITHFCSDPCRKQARAANTHTYNTHCIPSVTLRESKSLAVKPKCPASVRYQALSRIQTHSLKPKPTLPLSAGPAPVSVPVSSSGSLSQSITVTASKTFYLDPRNFTTFRMKLKPTVNTIVLFSLDSDIEFAIVTTNPHPPPAPLPLSLPPGELSGRRGEGGKPSRPTSSTKTQKPAPPPSHPEQSKTKEKITWLTPQLKESITHTPIPPPSQTPTPTPPSEKTPTPHEEAEKEEKEKETYVLIKPGKEMLKTLLDKRISVRRGTRTGTGTGTGVSKGQQSELELELFRSLEAPNEELIEYAQGLLLTGYLGEAFMYVFEWVWK